MRFAAALLAIALLAPVSAPAAPPRKATAAHDWASTVTRTAAGAFVMGNPRAKVRLVEYGSMTCSHCAIFAAEGFPALRADYVRRGLVSLEYRHALRDGADLAASLLARCAGPRAYFGALERIFAQQETWLPAAAAAVDGAPAGDSPATRNATLLKVANGAGLPALARIAPPAAAACLANAAEQATLEAMAEEAWATRRIGGTPAFLINDRPAAGSGWAQLAPQLAAALR